MIAVDVVTLRRRWVARGSLEGMLVDPSLDLTWVDPVLRSRPPTP